MSSLQQQTMADRRCINTFVFLDLESTGLGGPGARPKITEISLVSVHRSLLLYGSSTSPIRVLNKLTLCVYPMKPIDNMSAQMTGLYNETLYCQKDFDPDLVHMLRTFLRRQEAPICLIAHNGNRFDFPLLKSEFHGIDEDFTDDILCADSLVMFKELDEREEHILSGFKESVIEASKEISSHNGSVTIAHSSSAKSVKRKLSFPEIENGDTQPDDKQPNAKIRCQKDQEKTSSANLLDTSPNDANVDISNEHEKGSQRKMSTCTAPAIDINLEIASLESTFSVSDDLLIEAHNQLEHTHEKLDDGITSTVEDNCHPKFIETSVCEHGDGLSSEAKKSPEPEKTTKCASTQKEVEQSTISNLGEGTLKDGKEKISTNISFSTNIVQTPPKVKSTAVWKDVVYKTPQNAYTAQAKRKLSYKLGDVFERVVGRPMKNAHCAEDDCIALLRILQKRSKETCDWLDKNAMSWSCVEPMYPKSPNKRKPLSPGHFPHHDGK